MVTKKRTIKAPWSLKLFKRVSIIAVVFILFSAWWPLEGVPEASGKRTFSWSGWSALFNKKEFGLKVNYYPVTTLKGIDGPYLTDDKVYRVDTNQQIVSTPLIDIDSLEIKVDNRSSDVFFIKKRNDYKIAPSSYSLPEKIIAISDIEGNFNAFSSFLFNNGIIDKNFNWSFSNGHVVLVGDFVDRGSDVTQVLWLIYKLEKQAQQKGGQVHYILGNHEIMNFQGDSRYNQEKYIRVAQAISGFEECEDAVRFMYSEATELGKWIRTKNAIEKIGPYLFVHGGLHPEIITYNAGLEEINQTIRNNWDQDVFRSPLKDEFAHFLLERNGPLWYRGMAINYKYYKKIREGDLQEILNFYEAEKVIIGHTVVPDISTDYSGRIIKIDLKHGKEKNSGKTKGLLIEKGVEFKIDDLGNKELLR